MNETRTIGLPRRAVSFAAASALALAGTITLVTAQSAQADVMQQGDQVWVCKFVGKPYESELIKPGKNPIEVGWQAADLNKDGVVNIGDEFADGQGMSVVVQINGEDPGVAACQKSSPPPPTTTETTTSTGTETTTTTSTGTETTSTGTTTTSTGTTTTTGTGGIGGGVTPGVGAPKTGGSGDGLAANTLLGSGLLLAAGGVLTNEAIRRRRELARD